MVEFIASRLPSWRLTNTKTTWQNNDASSTSEKGESNMAKEKIKKNSGIFASVFAHAGHISKGGAKEISGLDDDAL